MESLDTSLRAELALMIRRVAEEDGLELDEDSMVAAVERSRSVLERVLLDGGEAFAEAVIHDRGTNIAFEDVEALVYTDYAVHPSARGAEPRVISAALVSLMANPPEEVRAFLRSLADTYTLFAFMRETPHVQSAIVKIFSDGDIWLDASVVLPLFAEDLLEEGTLSIPRPDAESRQGSRAQALRDRWVASGAGLACAPMSRLLPCAQSRGRLWFRAVPGQQLQTQWA